MTHQFISAVSLIVNSQSIQSYESALRFFQYISRKVEGRSLDKVAEMHQAIFSFKILSFPFISRSLTLKSESYIFFNETLEFGKYESY